MRIVLAGALALAAGSAQAQTVDPFVGLHAGPAVTAVDHHFVVE